ncbi:hypothetical protein POTOM_029643 [Populus tomentosa]|uniref:EF-hand domain-containing protein n=1 Tax=Populus tomentosa TaxID=118781 RepID=A0A8X8CT34_POPTO|nr:hypothetical protein POTOM_029643 [Populus tomentosa]
MVMNRLGLVFHEDGLGGDEGFGADELLSLFEEEEPCSLEELKEVFDVFDENKDGFIDARELNRVMCRLGLKEGMEVEECSRMIQAVGEGRKQKIDFNDFFRSRQLQNRYTPCGCEMKSHKILPMRERKETVFNSSHQEGWVVFASGCRLCA